MIAVLFIILFSGYGNSFHNDWHYDDFDNITENQSVHLKTLSLASIAESLFFRGEFSRPVSYLTFALNYYLGGTELLGYHVVNFAVHFLASWFLFLLIYGTLNLPALKDRYGACAMSVAVIAALFWAVNPLHVHAVTIIVQRMASMAGLFYVMAMYFYLRARTGENKTKERIFFALCAGCAILAFGTKQNTAVLPLVIFLYEMLLVKPSSGERWRQLATWALVPVGLLISLAFFYTDPSDFFNSYNGRPFTLLERLLTESRVFFYYLGLLFYPLPERLALLHDVTISRSFFAPWTTVLSVIGLIFVLATSWWTARRWPLFSFSVLFFLINHLIEGTVIPLELIFEHRNYIPSMFIFVPPALLVVHLWARIESKNLLRGLVLTAGLVILLFQVYTVYDRNRILRHDVTLWLDNETKYPNLSLVHVQLAKNYDIMGSRQRAYLELKRAYELNRYSNTFQKALVEYDLGQLWNSIDRHDKALAFYQRARTTWPSYTAPLVGMALVQRKEGHLPEAQRLMEKALQEKPQNAYYHDLAGTLFLHRGYLDEAGREAQKSLVLDPQGLEPLMILAEISRAKGFDKEAEHLWKKVLSKDFQSTTARLALMEIYDRRGDQAAAIFEAKKVLSGAKGRTAAEVIRKAIQQGRISPYRPDEARLFSVFGRIHVDEASSNP